MMKNKILYILAFTLVFSFASCNKNQMKEVPEIKITKVGEAKSLTGKVEITHLVEQKFLLKGGDGKYTANMADSKFASSKIVKDTLFVKGLKIGETYATIKSHDKSLRVDFVVKALNLDFEKANITLAPTEVKNIRLAGGGDFVTLKVEGEQDIISYKWQANSQVEITGLKEGDIKLVAKVEGEEDKVLLVKVRPIDEITEVGAYGLNQREYRTNVLLKAELIIKKEGKGIYLCNSALPYGGELYNSQKAYTVFIRPINNPVKDQKVSLNIIYTTEQSGSIKAGVYEMLVEDVKDDNKVLLKGKDFKMLLPY